jgi:hypothetical protein
MVKTIHARGLKTVKGSLEAIYTKFGELMGAEKRQASFSTV